MAKENETKFERIERITNSISDIGRRISGIAVTVQEIGHGLLEIDNVRDLIMDNIGDIDLVFDVVDTLLTGIEKISEAARKFMNLPPMVRDMVINAGLKRLRKRGSK